MNPSTSAMLLFNWQAPPRRNRAIVGFIAASFAAHVTGFYLFQIIYPPTVSLIPAPKTVNIISARSEEGAALLRWVDAEDPALAFATRRPVEVRRYLLGKIQHIPSYSENQPVLKEPPPLTVDLRVPSAQPPGPVPLRAVTKPPAIGRVTTNVTFSSELRPFGQPNLVPPNFKGSTDEPPQNAQFRIAVDSQGAVVYCFRLTSSGDASLDEQARERLALCRFPARLVPSEVEGSTSNGESLIWGVATIEWGNDVAGANPKATPSAP